MSKRYKLICGDCGSEDIKFDALVIWNSGKGEWELTTVYDEGKGYCGACGYEGDPGRVEIE